MSSVLLLPIGIYFLTRLLISNGIGLVCDRIEASLRNIVQNLTGALVAVDHSGKFMLQMHKIPKSIQCNEERYEMVSTQSPRL